jgi:N-glycosylase/DNA lyase
MSLKTKVERLERELRNKKETLDQVEACLKMSREGEDTVFTVKVAVIFGDLQVTRRTYESVMLEAGAKIDQEIIALQKKLDMVEAVLEEK